MQMPTPQKEHEWLQQLVGEWTYESENNMGPGQPVSKFKGKETVRSLGGFFVIGEGEGEMPGGVHKMIITIGYDPAKGHYVGSWCGDMMSILWVYKGTLDPTGKILTLAAEGPNFADGGKTTALFNDVITIVDNDHRTFTGKMQLPDGSWQEFMTAHYTRKK